MRLKPMFTARISLVRARSSSRCASYSPSRTCKVARDSCLSGRLMSRVISAAPASDSAIAVLSQTSQVRPPTRLKRVGSSSSQ
ncbi:hypothetical protein D9M69_733300 [compost metagenome]